MARLKTGPKVKRRRGGIAVKAAAVDQLGELASARVLVITDYRGLRVQDLQDLRRRLRPKGVEYRVVKNTLFARAAERNGRGAVRALLSGPTAVATGAGDEVELARGIVDELRTLRALKVVGALIGDHAIGADDVQSLARLPGRPQLQGALIGTLQSPLASVAGTLQAPLQQLIGVFAARAS